MERRKIPKESGEISRREFLKDAGLVVGGAAIGSTVLLAACGEGEVTTETVTATATTTVPGPTTTATVTQAVSTFVCPICSQEFDTLAALSAHFEAVHPGEVVEVAKSGAVAYNPSECAGCGVCEVMCSLYHEGMAGPALARSNIIREPITFEHSRITCQQCPSPSCYFACLLRDKALCIDEVTGARYINEDECTGCGLCIDACPFDPPRIKLNAEKKVVFKCDLCWGREEGPICVEYCPFQALTFVPKDER